MYWGVVCGLKKVTVVLQHSISTIPDLLRRFVGI